MAKKGRDRLFPFQEGNDEEVREAERRAVRRALEQAGGNRTEAARILGVSRRTLYSKIEELGLG